MSSPIIFLPLAFLVYLLAHALRALRYWLVLGDNSMSLKKVFLAFYIPSIFGFFVPLILIEPIRLVALCITAREVSKVSLAYFIHRVFDGLAVSLLLILLTFKLDHQDSSNFDSMVKMALLATLSLAVLASTLSLPSILLPVQEYLVQKPSSQTTLLLAKVAGGLSRSSKVISARLKDSNVLLMILTLLVWSLDIFSYVLVTSDYDWIKDALFWLNESTGRLFSFSNRSVLPEGAQLEKFLIYPQVIFCIAIVLFLFIRKSVNRFRSTSHGF